MLSRVKQEELHKHIGAYKVNVNDREITFLDTPGHEAFTSMRARELKLLILQYLLLQRMMELCHKLLKL